jgi:hypothetical protein
MCLQPMTLDPADLLLTKMQVRETIERDVKDALALLVDTAPDVDRVADVLCSDWGWWRTATEVLERVVDGATRLDRADAERVRAWADRLLREVERRPKNVPWRLGARVGDRVRWYEEPEENY